MVALLALLACHGPDPADGDGDTGGEPTVPCAASPCVTDVATSTWSGPPGFQAGWAVAARGDRVVVGAPWPSSYGGCEAAALALPDLAEAASWPCGEASALGGSAVAIGDPDGDGVPDVAIGMPGGGRGEIGTVTLLPIDAAGTLEDAAVLTVSGPQNGSLGADVAFAAVGPTPDALLVMGAEGSLGLSDAAIYAVDPGTTGEVAAESLDRVIRGGAGLGRRFAALDLDGDGQQDLAASASLGLGVRLFPGPWDGARVEEDALGSWTTDRTEDEVGDTVASVGDVTGDGVDDLAFGATDWGDEPYRAGRAYVVPGSTTGTFGFGAADLLPLQVRGGILGEGVGSALAGADVTGDGQGDLVVGASGVAPGHVHGAVLVFPGPFTRTVDSADAPLRVYAEHEDELFGRAIAAVDADGDAKADLVVGAPWAGERAGAVWLIAGAALVP